MMGAKRWCYESGELGENCRMVIRRSGGLVEGALSYSVVGAFLQVHNTLGYGFLESVYASALEFELRVRGHHVAREVSVVVRYSGIAIARQRLDMVVDGKLIIEIKSTEKLHVDAQRQLFNYLKATHFEIGLLLHFGREARYYRVVNQKPSSPNS